MPLKDVKDLLQRVTSLENKMNEHFAESGEIREALSWLKKAFWVFGGSTVTFLFMLATAVIVYLLNH